MPRPPVPLALKIVALLFILSGLSSAVEVLAALSRGHINLNFGVLGIFIGIGLLRYRPGWRLIGLVFLWIAMLAGPIVLILVLNAPANARLTVFGKQVGRVPVALFLLYGAVLYGLVVWQYRVLTRPHIRALFHPPLMFGARGRD